MLGLEKNLVDDDDSRWPLNSSLILLPFVHSSMDVCVIDALLSATLPTSFLVNIVTDWKSIYLLSPHFKYLSPSTPFQSYLDQSMQ